MSHPISDLTQAVNETRDAFLNHLNNDHDDLETWKRQTLDALLGQDDGFPIIANEGEDVSGRVNEAFQTNLSVHLTVPEGTSCQIVNDALTVRGRNLSVTVDGTLYCRHKKLQAPYQNSGAWYQTHSFLVGAGGRLALRGSGSIYHDVVGMTADDFAPYNIGLIALDVGEEAKLGSWPIIECAPRKLSEGRLRFHLQTCLLHHNQGGAVAQFNAFGCEFYRAASAFAASVPVVAQGSWQHTAGHLLSQSNSNVLNENVEFGTATLNGWNHISQIAARPVTYSH